MLGEAQARGLESLRIGVRANLDMVRLVPETAFADRHRMKTELREGLDRCVGPGGFLESSYFKK